MSNTYCGKNCDDCNYREELKCSGCKSGPGRELYGDCDIAACCRSSCLQQCTECTRKPACDTYNSATNKAYHRSISANVSKSLEEERLERSTFLGPQVQLIFIFSILQIICNLLSNARVARISINLYFAAEIAGLIVGIVYGIIMISMAHECKRFKFAGIVNVVAPVLAFVLAFIGGGLASFGNIVIAVLALMAIYQEMYGYSDILAGINNTLSMKWMDIWKKLMIWLIVTVISVVFMLIIPALGYIGFIVACIAIVVLSIIRVITLAETVKAFKNFRDHN